MRITTTKVESIKKYLNALGAIVTVSVVFPGGQSVSIFEAMSMKYRGAWQHNPCTTASYCKVGSWFVLRYHKLAGDTNKHIRMAALFELA